MVSKAHSVL